MRLWHISETINSQAIRNECLPRTIGSIYIILLITKKLMRWPLCRWSSDRMGSPRSEVNCSDTHCIYQNLWYNNGRFYLLVDGQEPVVSQPLCSLKLLAAVLCDAFLSKAPGVQQKKHCLQARGYQT